MLFANKGLASNGMYYKSRLWTGLDTAVYSRQSYDRLSLSWSNKAQVVKGYLSLWGGNRVLVE